MLFRKIIFSALLLAVAITACGCNQKTEATAENAVIDFASLNTAQSGISVKNNVVTVKNGGDYTFKGTINGGGIVVDAAKQEVNITLNGVDLSRDESVIYIKKAKNVTLTLVGENTLTDSAGNADDDADACIYSKADLVINGSGELKINAERKNGINSRDTLVIETSKITVNAQNHGICGKDSLTVSKAELNVVSGGDALRSTNSDDESLGFIEISDSDLTLESGGDGIQAETDLTISGGTYNIISGGGCEKAEPHTEDSRGASVSETTADTASTKGIKAGKKLSIKSGEFVIDSCDDALHTNGSAELSGGNFKITTGDDGVHCDELCLVSGGTVNIESSYEGLEGANVEITGGKINITAEDDGINAAGGNDGSGFFGDKFASGDYSIKISGGEVNVNASGDGVDSNGTLEVLGGILYVSGAENDGNGALDYETSAKITGGTVVASGMSGMAQGFGSESSQGSITVAFDNTATEEITLASSNGKQLLSYKPPKKYNCVTVSCADIKKGEKYTVCAGDEKKEIEMTDTVYSDIKGGTGGMGGFGGGKHGGGVQPEMPENGTASRPELPDNDGDSERKMPENGENIPQLPNGEAPSNGDFKGDKADSSAAVGSTQNSV